MGVHRTDKRCRASVRAGAAQRTRAHASVRAALLRSRLHAHAAGRHRRAAERSGHTHALRSL
jgi:hypothetical protein